MRNALMVSIVGAFLCMQLASPAHARKQISDAAANRVAVRTIAGGAVGAGLGFVAGPFIYPFKDGFRAIKHSFDLRSKWKPALWVLGGGIALTALMGGQPENLPVIGGLIAKVGDAGSYIAPAFGKLLKVMATGPAAYTTLSAAFGLATGAFRGAWSGGAFFGKANFEAGVEEEKAK